MAMTDAAIDYQNSKVATKRLLARVSDLVSDVSALRERLYGVQGKLDGAEPLNSVPIAPGTGLKAMVDRIETDLRAASRTLGTIEELL